MKDDTISTVLVIVSVCVLVALAVFVAFMTGNPRDPEADYTIRQLDETGAVVRMLGPYQQSQFIASVNGVVIEVGDTRTYLSPPFEIERRIRREITSGN